MTLRKNLGPAAAGAGDGAPAVREERVMTFGDVFKGTRLAVGVAFGVGKK